ncbi:MAG: hypothetical protein LAP39_03510 [Acidobacteriia bacterium]|nr:hypothetical protein [Terriglobia bacterium]
MCQLATHATARRALIGGLLACAVALGQTASESPHPDWRKIGSTSIDLMLAAPATGPVDQVWFAQDGHTLYARTHSGKIFETVDFENWTSSAAQPPRDDATSSAERLPVQNAILRASTADSRRVYALADHVYASEDGGRNWTNLTAYKDQSVIGEGQHDLAASPLDPSELVVGNQHGVWRSVDGGMSWTGLNRFLPNLTIRRILATPANGRGVEVEIEGVGAAELPPGNNRAFAWQPVADARVDKDAETRRDYSAQLGAEITAFAAAGDVVYAGAADGRIWVSLDRGRTWNLSPSGATGAVQDIFADAQAPRVALAAVGGSGAHVLRTTNTGGFWDDLTANLGDVAAHGVTADRVTGSVYVATDRGVYWAHEELEAPGQPSTWTPLSANLPAAHASAVALDPTGSQLYIALEGHGIYAAAAPHRGSALRVVNAADFSTRAAAPGSLVSVLGGPVRSAHSGGLEFPVLASSESATQLQVPFEANGPSVSLALDGVAGPVSIGLAVRPASPAIFVDHDGAPMLLDADTGLMLDASNTARSGARIQILATGLGRVSPEWRTGLAAPLENPPSVVAKVQAFLDRAPVEVTRATLAPGYVGLYLIELQLPALVNAGPAELYLTADGQESNRVRVYVEP